MTIPVVEETKRSAKCGRSAESHPHSTGSYAEIFRATSLLGGVQVVTVLVGLVWNKLLALLIGPAGVGVLGSFLQLHTLLCTATGIGLQASAVREVAAAVGHDDGARAARVVHVVSFGLLVGWSQRLVSRLQSTSVLSVFSVALLKVEARIDESTTVYAYSGIVALLLIVYAVSAGTRLASLRDPALTNTDLLVSPEMGSAKW